MKPLKPLNALSLYNRRLFGKVVIPKKKSSYNEMIEIHLTIYKVKDYGFHLRIEKCYLGEYQAISEKSRKFNNIDDLTLFVSNNYSIKINDFEIEEEKNIENYY